MQKLLLCLGFSILILIFVMMFRGYLTNCLFWVLGVLYDIVMVIYLRLSDN